jgi:hypothetical protein
MDLVITDRVEGSGVGLVLLEGSSRRAVYAPLRLGVRGRVERPLSAVLVRPARSGSAWLHALADNALHAAPDVLTGGDVGVTVRRELKAAACQADSKSAFRWTAATLDDSGAEAVLGIEGTCLAESNAATTRLVVTDPDRNTEEHALPGAPIPASAFLVHDLDGDGFADLVLGGRPALRIWWGGASGWPEPPVDHFFDDVRSLAVLDADGKPGKELAMLAGDAVTLLRFADRSPVALASALPVISGAVDIRAADVDGDGVEDLVVSNRERLQILRGVPHRPLPP